MLNLRRLNRNIRSLRRYRQILGTLLKYGFGQVLDQLQIRFVLQRSRQIFTGGSKARAARRQTPALRLRLAMEELGPTFIKFGQLLSTRPDVFPPEYIAEFSRLQDDIPAFPFELARRQIEQELEAPIPELFSHFDKTPLAAASIAQVYKAALPDGMQVAVKVRRPDIEQIVATDLDILMSLASLAEHHLPALQFYNPVALVKEFRRSIQRELNFTREGHTIERFAANFAGDSTFHVPHLYRDLCGETVLTMEFIEGIKVSNFEKLRSTGHDLTTIARYGANALLKQVLEHGLFHGDPHPGNIYILPGPVVCFLDYGMVGRLDRTLKYQLVDLLTGILDRDVEKVTRLLLESGTREEDPIIADLKKVVSDFIDDYYEVPLQEINTGRLLTDLINILVQFRIGVPPDLLLLTRALITMEGIGRQLDPDFNMVHHLKPFMERLARERLSPSYLAKDMKNVAEEYGTLMRKLPRDLRTLLLRINRNRFKINLEHRGLNQLITDLDKSSNRLSFSMLISALIVGSSLIMQVDKGPLVMGFPVLGFLGYTIAAVLGLWLAVAILRSGRL
jgi:ubiquinone biosynthesis protein